MILRHDQPAPGIDLYLGDCRKILPMLDIDLRGDVGMVLTDPPYGISYRGVQHPPLQNDDAPPVWCLSLMADMLRDNSAMYICTREDVAEEWREELRRILGRGAMKTSVIWDKNAWTVGDTKGDLRRQTEMMLVAHKGRSLLRPWVDVDGWLGTPGKEIRRDTNLWHHDRPRDKHSQLHPTPKPPEMMERAMLNSSDEGDLILDAFMGSGPVGVAAVRRGRRYIGIEIEEQYYRLALENIQHAIDARLDAFQRELEELAA